MGSVGSAYVDVRPDFARFNRGLRSELGSSRFDTLGKRAGRSFGRSLASGAKFGGVAIFAGVAVETKRAVDQWREAQKVGAQTRAVIKSTGGAAGITAKHVETLANKISLKAGMDDEAIQSAQNLLLTFKNLRNEAGRGNAIFDQATQTVVDMSVALGQDLKSSSIQVGKALNDPVKGMTALQRVGVTFDQQTKDNVKSLVDQGRRLEAQKIILRELKSEFGGSAEAQADGFDRAKVAVENLEESLGALIGPHIEKGLNRFADILGDPSLSDAEKFKRVGEEIKRVMATVWPEVREQAERAFPQVANAAGRAGPHVAKAFVEGILNADALGRLAVGTWLLAKFGGVGGFTALGRRVGTAFGFGMTTTAAAGGAAAGAAAGTAAGTATRVAWTRTATGGLAASLVPAGAAAGAAAGGAAGASAGRSMKSRMPAALAGTGILIGAAIGAELIPRLQREIDQARFNVTLDANDTPIIDAKKSISDMLSLGPQIGGFKSSFDSLNKALRGTRRDADAVGDVARGSLTKGAKEAREAIGFLERGGASDISQLRRVVTRNMALIESSMKKDSDAAHRAIDKTFSAAIRNVKKLMSEGVLATSEGNREIFRLMDEAAKALGVPANRRYFIKRGQAVPARLAGGGYIGGPGERGRDAVPAILGRGEAVLNRHQQVPVEQAMRTVWGYGLADLFHKERRPHYMATGGFVDLKGANRDLAGYATAAKRFGLVVSSGKRSGPAGASHHNTGNALDLAGSARGMLGFARAAAQRWGRRLEELIHTPLGFGIKNGQRVAPYARADHYDHVHLADTNAKGVAGLSFKIPKLKVTGPHSLRKAVIQGALDKDVAFANDYGMKALQEQAGGFARGGFVSTSYGPPWNAMNGTGVTATGVDLRPAKQKYGVAVDPRVIKLGSLLRVWPNPFGYRGLFRAFDTGGAIKGKRIDFYDWRGRAKQLGWGRRGVTVYGKGERIPGGGGGGRGSGVSGGQRDAARRASSGSTSGGSDAPTPFEARTAAIDLGIAGAERTGTRSDDLAAYRQRKRNQAARIAQLRKLLKTKLTPAQRQRYREELASLLGEYGQTLDTITDLKAPAPVGEGPAWDWIGARQAQAELTTDTGDDLAVAQEGAAQATLDYWRALEGGDPKQIAETAQRLKEWGDRLTGLRNPEAAQENTDALQANTEAMNALAQSQQAIADEMKRQNDIAQSVMATTGREALRAMADFLSGEIGGRGIHPRTATAGAGSVVRW